MVNVYRVELQWFIKEMFKQIILIDEVNEMDQTWGVKEFSQMTGFTVRTLHYYDEEKLLVPKKRKYTGIRIYTYDDFLTAQKMVRYTQMSTLCNSLTILLYSLPRKFLPNSLLLMQTKIAFMLSSIICLLIS